MKLLRMLLIVAGIASGASPAAAQTYHVRDLGVPPGPGFGASVNSTKQVAGCVIIPIEAGNAYRGFAGGGGAPASIGPLPGDTQAIAVSIDDAGGAACVSFRLGEPIMRSFLRIHDQSTLLGTFQARARSNSGDVVGCLRTTDTSGLQVDHACVKRGAGVFDLGTLGGSNSYAESVNESGAIAGKSFLAGDRQWRATLWLGTAQAPTRYDLGTLGGANSEARGMNNALQIVGVSDTTTAAGGSPHAFLVTAGPTGQVLSRIDLGVLPGAAWSIANAISNAPSPAVVGVSGSRAALWQGGQKVDLNSVIDSGAGWVLAEATGVNDRGDIVGWGVHRGWPRAFLLERCPGDVDGNGATEPADVARFVNDWLSGLQEGTAGGDYDGNGSVEPADIAAFVNAWLQGLSEGC